MFLLAPLLKIYDMKNKKTKLQQKLAYLPKGKETKWSKKAAAAAKRCGFVVLLLLSIETFSQEIRVGGSVPDIEFTDMDGNKFTMYGLKKRLVILDFWATWCGSCIGSFPKMDSLQQLFKHDMTFILVNSKNTGDTKESIKKTMNRFRDKFPNLNIIAINDTIADSYFPHREVPHYVWITNDSIPLSKQY